MGLLTGVMIIRSCALNTAHVKTYLCALEVSLNLFKDIPGLSIDPNDFDEDDDLIIDLLDFRGCQRRFLRTFV